MPSPSMQKANLSTAEIQVHGGIRKESLTVDGVEVARVTFAPGARWSTELAAKAGARSCGSAHVALVLSGVLRVQMDDGAVEDFEAGDVMLLPAGHDAWTIGDEPCVFVDFSAGYERYRSASGEGRVRLG